MNDMTKHPLFKVWNFPSTQMTRMPSNKSEMPVLTVKYEDKDKAKQQIGAQFDPIASMWFFNRYTKWNRDLVMDDVIRQINDNNWYLGYAYRDCSQSPNAIRYDTPMSNYTWLTQPVHESELQRLSTVSTYRWSRDIASSRPLLEIVIIQPTTGTACDRVAPTAFVVVYADSTCGGDVHWVREVSMDEARKLWDVCEKNFVFSTESARQGGGKDADPGFSTWTKVYIEQKMINGGITAAVAAADITMSDLTANQFQKNNFQHKSPTNYAVTA